MFIANGQAFVHSVDIAVEVDNPAAGRFAEGVAEIGDIDAHELELGREVARGKDGVFRPAEALGENGGHVVARGD